MKRLCIFVVALMVGFTVPAIGSDEVDSLAMMLNEYGSARGNRRQAVGEQVMEWCGDDAVFFDKAPQLTPTMSDTERDHPERKLTDVAERLGFYDASHLVKSWRQAYGNTPVGGA